MRGVQIVRAGRAELERPDDPVLVVQRGDQEPPQPGRHHLVLDDGPGGQAAEVVDDQRLAGGHRALVDGADELLLPVVDRVREDAGVLDLGPVVEEEHPLSLQRGQAQAQLGPAQQRAQPRLQLGEARGRHDRLAIDEVALERREHFLIGDVDRLEERHAAKHETVGRQDAFHRARLQQHGLQALAHVVG